MGVPRQEHWSGLPRPPPADLPNPGIEPGSPALQADSLPLSHQEAQRLVGVSPNPFCPLSTVTALELGTCLFLSLPCHQAWGTASSLPAVLCPGLGLRPQPCLFCTLFLPRELVPDLDGETVSTQRWGNGPRSWGSEGP